MEYFNKNKISKLMKVFDYYTGAAEAKLFWGGTRKQITSKLWAI